ncbi:MAG: alpha/beta hydrolase [Candidatus Roizmanbacteria bacterium]|nr:alpha/beta hydrolase [Candidatus Roizmanbacteria bacterium]
MRNKKNKITWFLVIALIVILGIFLVNKFLLKSPGATNGLPIMKGGPMENADTSNITRKWTNLAYASKSDAEKLDIYLPETGDGPFPVIISIHGGAFRMGDKADGQITPMLEGLKKGYAVIGVNYRLSNEAKFPAQINDIKAAIKFIRANANQYKLNANKIAVWGGSSGGNLSSLAGTSGGIKDLVDDTLGNSQQNDKVLAVVDWYGPIYFSTMDAEFASLGQTSAMGQTNSESSPETAYLGKTIGTIKAEELVKKASPQTYISSSTPAFYIQHGTADRNIPITQSINFSEKLKASIGSDKVIFEKLEGAGHGGSQFESTENLEKIFAFLDKYLK